MTLDHLQALVEIDQGEYHAFQCARYESSRKHRHSQMRDALTDLVSYKCVELIGDEYMLTQEGRDILDHAKRYVLGVGIR